MPAQVRAVGALFEVVREDDHVEEFDDQESAQRYADACNECDCWHYGVRCTH